MNNNSFRPVKWALVMPVATIAAVSVTSSLPEDSTTRAIEPHLSIVALDRETDTHPGATAQLNRATLMSGSFPDGYMYGLTTITRELPVVTSQTGTPARKPSR